MTGYRTRLPQLSDGLFVTDGGLETTLIFHDGIDLPAFAAFVLLETDEGFETLRRYYEPYAAIAAEHGVGLVLESPTWRSNPDWGTELGYSGEKLDDANRKAIGLLEEVRETFRARVSPIVLSGCIGPRGDGYDPASFMTAAESERYHERQIGVFAGSAADMVTAITMSYAAEAVGIARAARAAGIPSAISFTLETDGRLPDGEGLVEAITQVDTETDGAPAYYMINCAHPTHFEHVLHEGEPALERIRGLRVNASKQSHAELDESETLDDGDPRALGAECAALASHLPGLTVVGGCCGTDHRHVSEIVGARVAGA